MKAERRHELKENDLVHGLYSFKEWLETNGRSIGIILVAVAIALLAWTFFDRNRNQASARLWDERSALAANLAADDPAEVQQALDKLLQLTRETDNDTFALPTLIDQVRASLAQASLGDNPPQAEFNELARSGCQELLKRFPINPLAVGVARTGLATVEANAFVLDGDPAHKEQARTYLNSVLEDARLAGMPFQLEAADRLNELDETFTQVTFAPPLPPDQQPQAGQLPGLSTPDGTRTIELGGGQVQMNLKPMDKQGDAGTGNAAPSTGATAPQQPTPADPTPPPATEPPAADPPATGGEGQ